MPAHAASSAERASGMRGRSGAIPALCGMVRPRGAVPAARSIVLAVPATVVALLVLLLDRRPGAAVRGLLPAGVAAAFVGIGVLVPGAVEGFEIEFLGVQIGRA